MIYTTIKFTHVGRMLLSKEYREPKNTLTYTKDLPFWGIQNFVWCLYDMFFIRWMSEHINHFSSFSIFMCRFRVVYVLLLINVFLFVLGLSFDDGLLYRVLIMYVVPKGTFICLSLVVFVISWITQNGVNM